MVSFLWFAFVMAVLIQVVYWGIMFGRLAIHRSSSTYKKDTEYPPISIIICAFNEAENLAAFLPSILEQDYPNFEVLVVNDDSSDDTQKIIEDFKTSYPHLNTLHLFYPKGKKLLGKKGALAQGIRHAQHDWVLLTDADCYPSSNQWAKIMTQKMGRDTNIVFAYAPYEIHKGLLNAFIRFETVYTAIQYMSASLWGLPYMGVGRNMMYDRKLFFQAGGFQKHEHIASGDDDLFINEVANSKNTSIVLDRDTFMYSAPKKSWKSYWKQKSRHVTTGTHYHWKHQLMLGLLSASHFGMYATGLLLLLLHPNNMLVSLFLIVTVLKITIFGFICRRVNEWNLVLLFPILDILYILYYVILAPALFWGKTKQWK